MGSPSLGSPSSPPAYHFASLKARLAYIYRKEIWRTSLLKDHSPRGLLYAFLRVISITLTAFFESRITSRAAALSFSSLLGLGPLIAIAVLIGGFMLGAKADDDEAIAGEIGRVITLVAPQLSIEARESSERTEAATDLRADASAAQAPATTPAPKQSVAAATAANSPEHRAVAKRVDPGVVSFVGGIIRAARSGTGGVFGAISLITIVLVLFSSIEDAFNDIWGVRVGRSVLVRVVFYWTILTLGAVVFFAAMALLSAGAFVNVFKPYILDLPRGQELFNLLEWSLPVFSATLLFVLLTLVYRVIPNTRVFWGAAAMGALVVTALLLLNNYIALMYVRRVILTRSLYGTVALPLVLMFGLYFVWLYLLIGGIVSYAVQNVHFRNSQAIWSTLPERTRERLSLLVFLTICRQFRECLPPMTASLLSERLKVPTQLVNECLGRLEQLKLVAPLRTDPNAAETDACYQPTRPLNRVTLFDFKTLDDTFGENPLGNSLEHIDPLVAHYDAALENLGQHEFFQKPVDQLLAEHPFNESVAPSPVPKATG